MSLRRTIKEPLKYLVFLSFAQIGRWISVSGVPILTYHSLDDSGSPISTAPSAFRRQMHYLKDHGFTTIKLSHFIETLKSRRSFPEKAFVLTFDDGFENLYQIGFDILSEMNFTATVFLVTDYMGQKSAWGVAQKIKKVGAHPLPLLSWEEAEEMHRHGFIFGSQGSKHLHLTQIDSKRIIEDVEKSKWIIEDKLGDLCRLFCYPYGEFNEFVRGIINDIGFAGAVTTEFGRNFHDADSYALRRIGSAHFTNQQVFKASIYGTYGWHLRQKRKS